MTALSRWQADLAAVIDGGAAIDVALSALSVPGLSAEQACALYRGSSRRARVDALAAVYPACRRLLGTRCFDGLAAEFVRRSPSRGPDLNRFGDGFATFVDGVVGEQPVFAALPWLGELVALEWACHALYYAADDAPLDVAALADGDPARLVPRPASALTWLHTNWPVHRIRAAQLADAEPVPMHVDAGDCHLVIERRRLRANVVAVDAALWRLLDACARGCDLRTLAADRGLAVDRLGELVERGWLAAIERCTDAV